MNILITGGSRGIGAAAVRLFRARGDSVWFLYEKRHEQAQALSRETGAAAICCDVAVETQVQAAFSQLPALDALICNAGIAHYGLISEITPEAWRRIFAVNVDGIFHCVRAALPGMLQKQAGAIVTVSSMWGQVGASCEVHYSAAKAAVIGFTKALAKEVGPSGINVNCVAPGMIMTDMTSCYTEEEINEIKEDIPLGRCGTPHYIAETILFLASERSSYITGQIIGVNGGMII